MNSIQLIYYISMSNYINVVIMDEDDRTPMVAIERLSRDYELEKEIRWKLNGDLEKGTLLIYK